MIIGHPLKTTVNRVADSSGVSRSDTKLWKFDRLFIRNDLVDLNARWLATHCQKTSPYWRFTPAFALKLPFLSFSASCPSICLVANLPLVCLEKCCGFESTGSSVCRPHTSDWQLVRSRWAGHWRDWLLGCSQCGSSVCDAQRRTYIQNSWIDRKRHWQLTCG